MNKPEHKDLNPEVFELFDSYVHNVISRREFLHRVSRYAVGGLTASAILDYLSPRYMQAQQVQADDARLNSAYVEYDSPEGGGRMRALLTRLRNHKEKAAGVVVVHENRGLNPHIEDVARRLALAGYLVCAPDALSPLGGYPGNDDEGRAMQAQRDREAMLRDFIAAYEFLKQHPECSGKVGVVGFCFGGWVANMMAARLPELAAAVPFYGTQAPEEDVAAIQAPLLLHFAEHDARVNEGWPAYEAALQKHGKSYTDHWYPGVQHGFHNDTTPRYDKEAAELAWTRTLEFFAQHLRGQ